MENKLKKLYPLVGLIVILLCAYFIMQYRSQTEEFERFRTDYARVDAERKTLLSGVADLIKVNLSLRDSVKQSDTKITTLETTNRSLSSTTQRLTGDVTTLKQQLVSIRQTEFPPLEMLQPSQYPEVIARQAEEIGIQDTIIKRQDSIIVVNNTQLATKDSIIDLRATQVRQMMAAADLNQLRAEDAERILADFPDVPRNPNKWILGIPKPSRTTTFLMGVAATLLTQNAVGNLIYDNK